MVLDVGEVDSQVSVEKVENDDLNGIQRRGHE
jgi:hypothetical protein